MTDQFDLDVREPVDPWDDGTAAQPTVPLEPTGAVRTTGLAPRLAAAVVGIALLLGGIGFAVAQFAGGDDRTPEDAVSEFFAAVSAEDVLGVLATLDPGERDALAGPVEDLFAELERLEILDDAFDPSGVSGVDLSFEDLAFHTEPVRDDLVRVYLVGGRATFSVDTDALAVGDFVTDTLERFGIEHRGVQESDSTELDGTLDQFLAVRHGSEGWRVSLGYTAAEAARLDAGLPAPNPALALTPIGAATPEDAVEGFARAMAELDIAGMVARLSPAELRALHDYWPLLADGADLAEASASGLAFEIRDLELRSEIDGDRARVHIDGFDVGVTVEGTQLDVTYADGCVTYGGDLDQLDMGDLGGQPLCADDLGAIFEQSLGASGFEEMGIELPTVDPVRTTDTFVVAHRVDGSWYLAPVSTAAEGLVEGLRAIDRSHLEAFVDVAESFVGAFTGSMSATAFSGEGMEIVTGEPLEVAPGSPPDDLPRPGASAEPPAPDTWAAITAEVRARSVDAAQAGCILDGLQTEATTLQLYEIHGWLLHDQAPPPPTADVLFGILDRCGA